MLRICFLCVLPLVIFSGVTNISKFTRQDYPLAKPMSNFLLIVNNDGGIYKFEPSTRQVLWHNSLRIDLMSINMTSLNNVTGYFLPDLNGDFIYVSNNRNVIEVQREKLEKLLNLCFDEEEKHFVYDAINYYVIDTTDGSLKQLEEFLRTRQAINTTTNAIVRVDRKYLKSLKHETEENWNIISSNVEFLTVNEFLSPHKVSHQAVTHPLYKFTRQGAHKIEISERNCKGSYELESDSSFISIFSYDGRSFSKHKLEAMHLGQKIVDSNILTSNGHEIAPLFETYGHGQIMPGVNQCNESDQKKSESEDKPGPKPSTQPDLHSIKNELDPTQFCINSFRFIADDYQESFLKQIASQHKKQKQASPSPHRGKQQLAGIPAVSLVVIIVVCVVACYLGLRALSKNIHSMKDNVHQVNQELYRRIQEMERKLDGVEQLKKDAKEIYCVDYSRVLETNDKYSMFEAMLLGKKCRVYVLAKPLELEFMNLIEHLYEHQPNYIIKILYFEENADTLLVFVEINLATLAEKVKTEMSPKAKYQMKHQIALMVDNLLMHKIDVDCLSPDHIVFDKEGHMKFNLLANTQKIWQSPEHIRVQPATSSSAIFMVGSLIFYIHAGGFNMWKHTEDEPETITVEHLLALKKSPLAIQLTDKDIALENLLDRTIVQDRASTQIMSLKDISNHFYFWDISRKLAFVNEFSNYMETFLEDEKVKKLEEFSQSNGIITYPWSKQFHRTVLQEINNFKKYSYYSVKDLIRAIRNKTSHFLEISPAVREIAGQTKEELCQYFLDRFPKLICFMYVYSKKKKWKI